MSEIKVNATAAMTAAIETRRGMRAILQRVRMGGVSFDNLPIAACRDAARRNGTGHDGDMECLEKVSFEFVLRRAMKLSTAPGFSPTSSAVEAAFNLCGLDAASHGPGKSFLETDEA